MKKWIITAVFCLFAGCILCAIASDMADHNVQRIIEWPQLKLTGPNDFEICIFTFE